MYPPSRLRRRIRPALALVLLVTPTVVLSATAAQAQVFFVSDRTTFNTANPGLPVETFEAANVSAGSFVVLSGPITLSSTTNNGTFSTGSIRPNISITSESVPGNFVVLGTGTVPGATKAVGIDDPGPLDLLFTSPVTAVGLDLFASVNPGSIANRDLNVSVFGTGGLLGSTTVNTGGGIPFLGITATGGITRVSVNVPTNDSAFFVDNVAFGGVPNAAIYNTRAAFNAANPSQVTEDFQEARAAAGSFVAFNGPLDAATNNAAFLPGEIIPNLSLGNGTNSLIAIGDGTVPGTTKSVGVQNPALPLTLNFSSAPGGGISAVGFDLFSSLNPGTISSGSLIVSVFDTNNNLAFSSAVDTGGGIPFFGARLNSGLIGHITIANSAANGPNLFVDNVTFSSAAPEPGSIALLGIGLAGMIGAGRTRRRGA